MKGNKKAFFLSMLVLVLLTAPLSLAQLDSLATWENIADGTLTATWTETDTGEWTGQNDSGNWVYNCTTDDWAWTYNPDIFGSRWYQTFLFTSDDDEAGIASIMVDTGDDTSYYGVIYYLNGADHSTPPPTGVAQAYIFYVDQGAIHYWDGSGYTADDNVSNATDLSNDCEWNYISNPVRAKALWNFNYFDGANSGFSVRLKLWENPNTGIEPTVWLVNETYIPFYGAEINTSYYPGLFVDSTYDLDASRTDFQQIMFWNLSYYAEDTPLSPWYSSGPGILCPTYDMDSFMGTLLTIVSGPDLWEQTQLLKGFMNSFDLISYYDDDFYGEVGNQNDTTYVFSTMLTDVNDWYGDTFPGPVPDEIPDNALLLDIYETTDGSISDGDACLVRIDSDNNDVYDSYDYAFLIYADGSGPLFYKGWTELTDPDQWYGEGYDSSYGLIEEVFRDASYNGWAFIINWDLLYNNATGLRIGDDLCRMSISFWDDNTTALSVLGDFNIAEDTEMIGPASEEYDSGTDPVFLGFNDSQYWLYFQIDETLSGEPLSDPEDPATAGVTPLAVDAIAQAVYTLICFVFVLGLVGLVMNSFGKWGK